MKKGFTLIETIVVIAVIALTLPVLISTVFILTREQTKVFRLSQVKREGDYLINIVKNSIRDGAITVHSAKPADESNIVCDTDSSSFSGSSLYFLDKNQQWFGYEGGSNTIASASANPSINLTSSKILVSNFSVDCLRNTIYSPPSVLFSFDVCYDTGAGVCTSTRPEEIASLHYQTRIKLRNY
ncbi:MAG: type II secretion system protein [Patescibacteria group bacterium]